MSKHEVMEYIRKEYKSTLFPHFRKHLRQYEVKIYPVCERGKQKKVTLPWETILSKDRTLFHFQVFGNKEEIDSLCVAEFDWQGQHCFAYIKHGLIIVFSEHALLRYEERVLESNTRYCVKFESLVKLLLKFMPLSYRTILPSRTHPLCYYFVVLDALFLGDFDDSAFSPEQKHGEVWLNTCISLKETGASQKGILKTLQLMAYFIKDIGFNPFDSAYGFEKIEAIRSDPNKWSALLSLCKSVFLIDKLFVMMDLHVSPIVIDCIDKEMKYAGALLEWGGVDISKLSPYGPKGIAIRGELDYKGK